MASAVSPIPAEKGGDMEPCVFCEIVAGRASATIKAAWPNAIVIVPLNPVTIGHELVIPREHVVDALSDPAVTAATFARAAEWATWPCNLITSAGRAATQTVRHLHVHIVPRQEHDGLPLPWTPQQQGFVRYERTENGWETTFHESEEVTG